MRRVAYFDCFSGASGDMILGALLHARGEGPSLEELLSGLNIGRWSAEVAPVSRSGIGALRVSVHAEDPASHGRHLSEILGLIRSSGLPEAVQEKAVAVFERLGAAEAAIHQTDVESLHFHEVGALDAIVDIVGTCALLDHLEVDRIVVSPLPMGRGFVECMHGIIPLPAPAVVELTRGVPVYGADLEAELVTPTGAALLTTLASEFGPMPAMQPIAVGYGAGARELADRPNLLRVILGESFEPLPAEEVAVLETNIDDLVPQFFEAVMDRLFQAGALDVYYQPVHMKKNRPGILLSVICAPDRANPLAEVLLRETTTLGVRMQTMRRHCLEREITEVATSYGSVRMKVARLGGEDLRAMPEYEDVRKLANEKGVPLMEVWQAAMTAYAAQRGER